MRFFSASKTSGDTLLTCATPWMEPVPSRKIGKQQFAALARVVEPSAESDGLPLMPSNLGNGGDGRRPGLAGSCAAGADFFGHFVLP